MWVSILLKGCQLRRFHQDVYADFVEDVALDVIAYGDRKAIVFIDDNEARAVQMQDHDSHVAESTLSSCISARAVEHFQTTTYNRKTRHLKKRPKPIISSSNSTIMPLSALPDSRPHAQPQRINPTPMQTLSEPPSPLLIREKKATQRNATEERSQSQIQTQTKTAKSPLTNKPRKPPSPPHTVPHGHPLPPTLEPPIPLRPPHHVFVILTLQPALRLQSGLVGDEAILVDGYGVVF